MNTKNLINKYHVPAPRYTSYPTVPYWNPEIPDLHKWKESVKFSFDQSNSDNGISLYVHLPFCESLCTYCACNTRITRNHQVEEPYIQTVLKEWALYREVFADKHFAIQMASQQECELTFFHSYYIMKPTSWAEKTFTSYENHEATKIKTKLEKFIASVYNGMGILPGKINHVIVSSFIADANIMKYAKDKAFDLICISRRGEGKMKKIFGTNTSNLILQSVVPVIAVPNTYRQTKIKSFLYASDLSNLEKEMKKVVDFASPFGAEIEILHLNYPSDIVFNAKVIEHVIHKFPKSDI